MPAELPEESETHGWLIAATEKTPPNGCTGPDVPLPGSLLFVAGQNGVWTQHLGSSVVLRIGDTDLLSIERGKDGLLFNADIFNESGNLAVRIVRNEFRLITGEYSYKERSDDRRTLAVYDKKGREMLYIHYANTGVVKIRGLFETPDKTRVQIDDDKILILDVNNTIRGSCKAGFGGEQAGIVIRKNGFSL